MPIRLLALDIDGTLVNGEHELTAATRDAVRRAKAAGVEVALVTGRRYGRTLPLAEPIGISVPLVTANGALIKQPSDHATLFRAQFTPGTVEQMLRIIDQHGLEAVMYGDTFGEGFDFYCRRLDTPKRELAEYFELNPDCAQVRADLVASPPAGLFAGFTMGTRDEMLWLEAELNRQLPGEIYSHVIRSPRYSGFMCEVVPAGVSKWTGVLHLAEERGIAPAEICAVGDDVNDIPMVVGAGLGVAMGNAVPELKAVANRIAPCNNSDGLVEVVRWILG
jgi:Cof subfamily protein (haloacid dehalogenase superfamily)